MKGKIWIKKNIVEIMSWNKTVRFLYFCINKIVKIASPNWPSNEPTFIFHHLFTFSTMWQCGIRLYIYIYIWKYVSRLYINYLTVILLKKFIDISLYNKYMLFIYSFVLHFCQNGIESIIWLVLQILSKFLNNNTLSIV